MNYCVKKMSLTTDQRSMKTRVHFALFCMIILSAPALTQVRAAEEEGCNVSIMPKSDVVIKQAIKDIKKIHKACFDPEENTNIQKYYSINNIYPSTECNMHENKERMHRMHQTILKRS